MSTMLEAELLQAAEAEGALGNHARAALLRQRAAWVRELVAHVADIAEHLMAQRLTGPIPAAETAPTERTP